MKQSSIGTKNSHTIRFKSEGIGKGEEMVDRTY